jgi:hypothetical protein
MTETPFDAESVLQALIAQHAEVLTDEDAGQGRLLLVRREVSVADREDSGGRWSLDHLYVDAAGVPTLVEVKRSSDTRGRREVVAQMLDYASNAKISFSAEKMAAWAEEDATVGGTTGAQMLGEVLGVDDPQEFWASVATNLDAERFRLVFVSDVIGPELRRIIEFLNGQMTRTDVLAIEVKQYVDADGQHQTVVPRVIGNTEEAKRTKRARSRAGSIDQSRLLSALSERSPQAVDAAQGLLDWAETHPDLWVRWTAAANIELEEGRRAILRIWAEGTLEIKVNTLRHLGWNDEQVESWLQRIEQIPGVTLQGNRRRWPRTPLKPLADPAQRRRLLDELESAFSTLV